MRIERFYLEFDRLMAVSDSHERARSLACFLESHGYRYGARSTENVLLIQQHFPVHTLHRVLVNALRTPLPDMALNAFERLSGIVPHGQLMALADRRKRLAQMIMICGSSPFLVNLLYKTPAAVSQLFLEDKIDIRRTQDQMLSELQARIDPLSDFPQLVSGLRQFKRLEILRIAARDLNSLATLEEVTEELSCLAAASLQVAHDICRRILTSEYGRPIMTNGQGAPVEAAMTVIGMGKLGGNELNFSSDIDIIYFHESDQGETEGVIDNRGNRSRVIALHAYFNKLAELITKALSQITEDGFVFRVDLGLRPEGMAGDMANSLRSAEIYYESWGQPWERAAMLKARPVAGSLELGHRLLDALEPFIYRRFLDYSLIEDMKNMKLKIDASLARSFDSRDNLKLGRGGIREIEFFVQAMQLVYAGKQPTLRERNTLKALDKLLEARLIKGDDHHRLSQAYRFLRQTEHRLQVVHERQTHSLPTGEEELRALARRCGFVRDNGTATFRAELKRHRSNVSSIYEQMFHTRDSAAPKPLASEAHFLLDRKADPNSVRQLLSELGFEQLDRACENLLALQRISSRASLSERNRQTLELVMPLMLQELKGSPDPDMALRNMERFISALGLRPSYYALLAENRDTIKLLASLFGMSEFLSKTLINHPELLESMATHAYASALLKPKAIMEEELAGLLGQAGNFEDQLEILRRYRNEEFLRIGLNDINCVLSQHEITGQLTLLGECCLAAAQVMAANELRRYGRPMYSAPEGVREAGLAVIAMGKMGAGALNYHSDLDIIFVYDHPGQTDGEKCISNHEYFARLAQKIIAILTLQTREGYVYRIDTRLRPSGNAGPLVTSLESFREYHRHEAQIWERLALTRARVVLGQKQLADRLTDIIRQAVYSAPISDRDRREIHRLRMRMENELAREYEGSYNIKTGRGGMVDVEFTVQYLQLLYGREHPQLRCTGTFEALRAIRALGLLPEAIAKSLHTGYRFLRKLENRLRIIHDRSVSGLGGSTGYLDKLALRMGYDSGSEHPGAALISDYESITAGIRDCYDSVLGTD